MNVIRKLHPSTLIKDDGPPLIVAGSQTVTVLAGVATNLQTINFAIDQADMPVNQLVVAEFQEAALTVEIVRRINATAGQMLLQLLYYGNVAQTDVILNWALIRVDGFK